MLFVSAIMELVRRMGMCLKCDGVSGPFYNGCVLS